MKRERLKFVRDSKDFLMDKLKNKSTISIPCMLKESIKK